MTALTPHERHRGFQPREAAPTIELFLSDRDGSAAHLAGRQITGFSVRLSPVHPADEIAPTALAGAAAAVLEVSVEDPQSLARFSKLAAATDIPLYAAAYEAPLATVRMLLKAGAHDVLPLPLKVEDLAEALAPLTRRAAPQGEVRRGRLVCAIKSGGGVGATSLLSQLAVLHAERHAAGGGDHCLIDLDLQFGDAAVQLGLRPALSVVNLVEAGSRLDRELFDAAAVAHPSGLKVIGAPSDLLPLDSVSSDRLLQVTEQALGRFDAVFVDLPANWTDWSLSLVARADLVLLVTELSIPHLRQARRQIDLLGALDLDKVEVRVVLNRYEERLFSGIRRTDASDVLGREVGYTVDNDPALMRAAVDQGVPLGTIKRRSKIARDLGRLSDDIAALTEGGR